MLLKVLCLVFLSMMIMSLSLPRDDLFDAVYINDLGAVTRILARKEILSSRAPVDVNRIHEHSRTSIMVCGMDPQFDLNVVDDICVKIITLLLQNGANLSKIDKYGWNALSLAAIRGLSKVVRFLVSQGLYINSRDNDGRTSLMKAIAHGHVETVQTLLELGADITLHDNSGLTALHFASQLASRNSSYLPLLEFILSEVPNHEIDSRDRDGRTALMHAAILSEKEHHSSLELLLKYNANPSLVDYFDVSVVSLCASPFNRQYLSLALADFMELKHSQWLESHNQQREML